MFALLTLIAQAAPADNSAAIFAGIVAVLGAVSTIIGHVTGKKAGRAESVNIANQPLMVKMTEEFVTRREFERLENQIGRDVVEMKGLFTQTMQAIGTQNASLTKKIENLATRTAENLKESNTSHQTARGRIHTNLNRQGELLAALSAKVSIGEDIRALADAVREDAKQSKEDGE
jgi:hypothetical protein